MRKKTKPMSDKTDMFKRAGVTSNDVSKVVPDYLTHVQTIRDLQNSQPRAREVAYRLILDLQAESYGNMAASYAMGSGRVISWWRLRGGGERRVKLESMREI
jgi:hypothetical protein